MGVRTPRFGRVFTRDRFSPDLVDKIPGPWVAPWALVGPPVKNHQPSLTKSALLDPLPRGTVN